MLGQNITIILSTLLGGILTAGGGFLASYYMQSSSNKAEKRKEQQTRIEQLYLITNDIKQTFYRLEFNDVSDKDWTSEMLRVNKVEIDMEMLVTLYLPELAEALSEYLKGMTALHASFEGIHDKELVRAGFRDDGTEIIEMRDNAISKDIENASETFQNALAELLEKQGYR